MCLECYRGWKRRKNELRRRTKKWQAERLHSEMEVLHEEVPGQVQA